MTAFPLARLLRPELSELAPYLPVQGKFEVRLDANEAPALLSNAARSRLSEVAAQTNWGRYPDPTASKLRSAIAARCAVTPEEVLVGVGSDEIIGLLLTVLSEPRSKARLATLLTTTPTFVMYRMSARVRGLQAIEVPLDEQWDLSLGAMLRAIELCMPNLIFVASPNNPTSTLAGRERLEALIQAAPEALVVIDEAYVDYADGDQLELYRKYDNVALLRTLSKIGFASLRVGWLLGRPELVRELDKARLPYNMSTLSQELGALALTELLPEISLTLQSVVAERARMSSELSALPGVSVTPSAANFLWLRTERPAERAFEALIERGILVRSFHQRGGRLAHQLRVTLGTPQQNDAFLSGFREVV